MTFLVSQQLLIQASFVTLFAATLSYWIRLALADRRRRAIDWLPKVAMQVASVSILMLLLERGWDSRHLPLSNLYESLLFLCWSLIAAHTLLENRVQNDWLGGVTAPSALFVQGFASLGLPKEMQLATALVPALQSNWLIMHVSTMMLSYGALLFGSLLSVILLVVNQARYDASLWRDMGTDADNVLAPCSYNTRKSKLLDQLDYWSYRSISLGFACLTIGILAGAVWANEAWGSYWSWDPKETWALVTWLVFATYLHTRITRGWTGIRGALVASAGLWIVWMCYLGVNLLGKGLHSYGWLD